MGLDDILARYRPAPSPFDAILAKHRQQPRPLLPWEDPENPLRQVGVPTDEIEQATGMELDDPRTVGDAGRRVLSAAVGTPAGVSALREMLVRTAVPQRFEEPAVAGVVGMERRALELAERATGLPLSVASQDAAQARFINAGTASSPVEEAIADTAAVALGTIADPLNLIPSGAAARGARAVPRAVAAIDPRVQSIAGVRTALQGADEIPTAAAAELGSVTPAPELRGPSRPFPRENDLVLERLRGAGFTDEQLAKLREVSRAEDVDSVTGFDGKSARWPTLERAQRHVVETGDPAVYAEIDLRNLGGGNAALGHQRMDDVYRGFADDIRGEVQRRLGDSATVHFFRHGGDEMSVVAVGPGARREALDEALAAADGAVRERARGAGVGEVPHPKRPGERGMGLHWGTAAIDGQRRIADIVSEADQVVEARKLVDSGHVDRRAAQALGVRAPEGLPAGAGGRAHAAAGAEPAGLEARAGAEAALDADPPRVGRYPQTGPHGPMSTRGVANVRGMQDELEKLAEEHAPLLQRARQGRQSVSQYHDAKALSDQLGLTVEDFLQTPAGTVLGSREVALGRSLLGGLRDRIKTIADDVAAGKVATGRVDAARTELARLRTDMAKLMATLQGRGASEWGRGLRSLQEEVDPLGLTGSRQEQLHLGLMKRYKERLDDDAIARIAQLDPERPEDIVGFLRQMEKPTWNQYRSSYWIGSVLSGTKTLLRNTIGNAVKLATDTGMRPLEAAVDAPLARLQRRARGKYVEETVPAMAGLFAGVPKGLRRFAYVIRKGYDPEALVNDLIGGELGKWGEPGRLPVDAFVLSKRKAVRAGGAALNYAGRVLAATDALSRTMADSSERYAFATRQAIREARAGKASDVAGRAAEILLEQPPAMLEAARRAARKATYTDPMSAIGRGAAHLRKWAGPFGEPLLPFIRVSDRVAASITDFIPFAKSRKLWDLAITKKSPEAADLIARQAFGGVLGLVGLGMAERGVLVGPAPKDAAEKNRFYDQGKQPYSIRVAGRWVPFRDVLGPLAGPFVAAAALHQAWKERDHEDPTVVSLVKATGGGALSTAKYMLSASYLDTLQKLLSAVDDGPEEAGGKVATFLSRTAAGYLPLSGLLRGVATAADPRVVDTSGNPILGIAAGVPGLRELLPGRVDPYGRDMHMNTGRAGGFSPVVPTREEHDPVDDELERIGFTPGFVGTRIKDRALTRAERHAYQRLAGQYWEADIQELMASEDWAAMDDEERMEAARDAMAAARRDAREELFPELYE